MKSNKNPAVLVMLIVIAVLSCMNAWCEKPRPLNPDEKLAYEKEFDKHKALTMLRIYYENKGARSLVRQYQGLACNTPQLSLDDKLLFFVLDLGNDKYDPNYLFVYDGRTGRDKKLFCATCQYAVTPDARYLCYERRSYRKVIPWKSGKGEDVLSIPVVVLVDLTTMQERSFDFTDQFLKDQLGAGVYVKFDAAAKGFRLRFFMESKTYSKGIISLDDLEYHEDGS